MSKTRQTRKLDLQKRTLRRIDANDLRVAAGGIGDEVIVKNLNSRGRGTVGNDAE